MTPSDELRAQHAAAVPVYVRAEGDAWVLVDTSTDEVVSAHATPREALATALERDDVRALIKRANLRTGGEPDGVWRWLDASAEEDAPIGGSRITAESLWEMAAGLNQRASAIPINGGGAPEGGYSASEPHGDARHGDGAHPANGWAHVSSIVVEADGRTHLYLYSELLPEIAREVDRGRLAYGSIFMAFESVDEADNNAVIGAVLISHALTNDPAVTTLTAGSERTRRGLAVRTRRYQMPTHLQTARDASKKPGERVRAAIDHVTQSGARGPISAMLTKVMQALGITDADLATNPWALEDSMFGLLAAAKFEKKAEGAASAPPASAPAAGGEQAASARQRAGLREIEGMTPEQVSEAFMAMVSWGREVLGKPDASPADVLAELEARKSEVGQALGTDTPESDPEAEQVEESDGRAKDEPEGEKKPEEDAPSDPEDEKGKKDEKGREARSRDASELAAVRTRAESAERDLAAERAKVQRYETREWLDAEITKRKLGVKPDKREKWTEMAIAKGRDVVLEILDGQHRPPTSNPLDELDTQRSRVTPQSYAKAVDSLMGEARESLVAKGIDPQNHVVRAAAQRLAAERYPDIKPEAGAAAST